MQRAVALELLYTLRDHADFTITLAYIDTLPEVLRESSLVQEQRALVLSKSGNHDVAIGALLQLMHLHGETSERQGLLGGRYKKKWSVSKDPADLSRAVAAYEAGMKLDLNDYYPSSNLARLYRTRKHKGDEDKARIAAAVALTACERAKLRHSSDDWLNPTLLGAAFDAGDVEKAQNLAHQVAIDGPAAWKIASTLEDCRVAARLHDDPKRTDLLAIADQLNSLIH